MQCRRGGGGAHLHPVVTAARLLSPQAAVQRQVRRQTDEKRRGGGGRQLCPRHTVTHRRVRRGSVRPSAQSKGEQNNHRRRRRRFDGGGRCLSSLPPPNLPCSFEHVRHAEEGGRERAYSCMQPSPSFSPDFGGILKCCMAEAGKKEQTDRHATPRKSEIDAGGGRRDVWTRPAG